MELMLFNAIIKYKIILSQCIQCENVFLDCDKINHTLHSNWGQCFGKSKYKRFQDGMRLEKNI